MKDAMIAIIVFSTPVLLFLVHLRDTIFTYYRGQCVSKLYFFKIYMQGQSYHGNDGDNLSGNIRAGGMPYRHNDHVTDTLQD